MISSSDSPLTPKAVVALVSISFVTGSLLFGAGYYYMGLGCDGGWYSYPALSLSRGGSPVENLSGLDEIEPVEGVKALFGFKTHTSIRSFYTTLWLKYLPDTIYSLKLLSLLELLLLFGAFYLLISRFSQNVLTRLLLLGIFVNDKTVLLSAASDFRPDLMVAALSCITLALIADRKRASSLVLAMVLSSLTLFTHVTGVIPIVFVMSYAIVLNILDGRLGLRDNYMYLVMGMTSLLIFMNADGILDRLLQSGSHVLAPTVVAGNKISALWAKGVEFIVSKELTRWKTYFFTSNVTQLLVLLVGVILCFRPSLSFLRKDTMGLAMLISLGMVFTFLAVFDPHRADTHAVSVIPFFFVLSAHAIETRQMYRKQITYVLAGLLCIASLSSIALFLRVGSNARTSGYSIAAVSGAFDELVSRSDHTYRIVGPTEIWPFMPAQRNVLIIDKTRSREEDNMRFIEQIVDSLDYAVVNHDYHANGWEERFLRHFPYYDLETIRTVGSGQSMMKIYGIRRKKEPSGGGFSGRISDDVPRHATSQAVAGGTLTDVAEAGRRPSVLFIHHSVGESLIKDGGVREILTEAEIDFWDHGYNDANHGLTNEKGKPAGCYWIPDDNTDPDGLAKLFELDPKEDNALSMILRNHDIIAFKSCFPASQIYEDNIMKDLLDPQRKSVHNYKRHYLKMRAAADRHPEKIFIVVTQPPLHPSATNLEEARRARAFVEWLKSGEFLGDRKNLVIFDYFSLLADERGMLRAEYQIDQESGNSHPSRTAQMVAGVRFADFMINKARLMKYTAEPEIVFEREGLPHDLMRVSTSTVTLRGEVRSVHGIRRIFWSDLRRRNGELGSQDAWRLGKLKLAPGVTRVVVTAVDEKGVRGSSVAGLQYYTDAIKDAVIFDGSRMVGRLDGLYLDEAVSGMREKYITINGTGTHQRVAIRGLGIDISDYDPESTYLEILYDQGTDHAQPQLLIPGIGMVPLVVDNELGLEKILIPFRRFIYVQNALDSLVFKGMWSRDTKVRIASIRLVCSDTRG